MHWSASTDVINEPRRLGFAIATKCLGASGALLRGEDFWAAVWLSIGFVAGE